MKKRYLIYKTSNFLGSRQTDFKPHRHAYHRGFDAFFYAALCISGKGVLFAYFFSDKLRRTRSMLQFNTESAIFYVHRCTYLCAWSSL